MLAKLVADLESASADGVWELVQTRRELDFLPSLAASRAGAWSAETVTRWWSVYRDTVEILAANDSVAGVAAERLATLALEELGGGDGARAGHVLCKLATRGVLGERAKIQLTSKAGGKGARHSNLKVAGMALRALLHTELSSEVFTQLAQVWVGQRGVAMALGAHGNAPIGWWEQSLNAVTAEDYELAIGSFDTMLGPKGLAWFGDLMGEGERGLEVWRGVENAARRRMRDAAFRPLFVILCQKAPRRAAAILRQTDVRVGFLLERRDLLPLLTHDDREIRTVAIGCLGRARGAVEPAVMR